VPVRGRICVNNSEVALELARGGIGVALLAEWLVRRDVDAKRLVRLLDGYEAPPAPVYLLTPPSPYTASAVRLLRDHLAVRLPARLTKGDAAVPARSFGAHEN
jgi:DNA-binding transcriptional LysR family regulator